MKQQINLHSHVKNVLRGKKVNCRQHPRRAKLRFKIDRRFVSLLFFTSRNAGKQSATAIAGGINFSDGTLSDASYTIRMNSGAVPSTSETLASSGTVFQNDDKKTVHPYHGNLVHKE